MIKENFSRCSGPNYRETCAYSATTRQLASRQLLNNPWDDLYSFPLWKPQGSPFCNSFLEAQTFCLIWLARDPHLTMLLIRKSWFLEQQP